MKDGPDNIRYIVVNTTHTAFQKFREDALSLHKQKEADNDLTVIPFDDGQRALIKICGPVGWMDSWNARLRKDSFILEVYTYDQLKEVNRVLAENVTLKEADQ